MWTPSFPLLRGRTCGGLEEELRLADLKIALQSLDVCLECLLALGRDATDGAGALALERLYDFDVACCRQFFDLHTEVACRSSRLLLDVGELGFEVTDEQRHDGQSQLGVQQWV